MLASRDLLVTDRYAYEEGYWQISDPSLKNWRKDLGGLWNSTVKVIQCSGGDG